MPGIDVTVRLSAHPIARTLSQTLSTTLDWNSVQSLKRTLLTVVASGGLMGAIAIGIGPATARADILDDLAGEYSVGAGAGQVANLLNESLQLRSQGFVPKRSQYVAIQDALSYRPNQTQLVQALQEAIGYQSRLQAQSSAGGQSGGATIGINQCDFNSQWNPQQGGISWPPQQDYCNGPFSNGGGVVIGGGQTTGGNYRIGNGRWCGGLRR